MEEVRYSVNGLYFKDLEVYVSDSKGLFDNLKRKPLKKYEWAEYNGESVDLSAPRWEARDITLECFVRGDNWLQMQQRFDALMAEFRKAGTQRLIIQPFGMKPLFYEVYNSEETSLNKQFDKKEMFGVFSLKLTEPNPVKIVLHTTLDTLALSYNSPKETEIFYGNGVKDVASGNVSFSGKALVNRVLSGYSYHGRNLALNSKTFLDQSADLVRNFVLSEKLIVGQQYTVRVRLKAIKNTNDYFQISDVNSNNSFNLTKISPLEFGVTFTANSDSSEIVLTRYPKGSGFWYQFESFKIEKGNKATSYSVAPEDEKYIIIAGNVEEITNLTTNANVLWERL